mmetsp:Transcript_8871/g.19790  ORF Transcript_8871/g.19790 Transcript_8871/m.19790 type:complete len:90 (+) Transcript_8871:71-340(+)
MRCLLWRRHFGHGRWCWCDALAVWLLGAEGMHATKEQGAKSSPFLACVWWEATGKAGTREDGTGHVRGDPTDSIACACDIMHGQYCECN